MVNCCHAGGYKATAWSDDAGTLWLFGGYNAFTGPSVNPATRDDNYVLDPTASVNAHTMVGSGGTIAGCSAALVRDTTARARNQSDRIVCAIP